MTQDQPIVPFDWFANQFTFESREEFIDQVSPYLRSFIKVGDYALDLCCGAGPIAFFLEDQGAHVTGIDLAPSLIAMARQEAIKRGSRAAFIHASVLTHPLGNGVYDLAVCFGNAILDFPHQSFPQFRDRVYQALKSRGRFVIEYRDGLLRVAHMSEPKEVIEQGLDSQILRRF
ncbi:MAG: class I SAM-dependent methyltransferase [Candidatus Marinimicrobia bacterium]|nr:class I SAM-dependent methyltransferase [Candidatus Neomarinimicrobiota bacterium]